VAVEVERQGAQVLGEAEARREEPRKVVGLGHGRWLAQVHEERRPWSTVGRQVGGARLVGRALDVELVAAALPEEADDARAGRDDGLVADAEERVEADACVVEEG